LIGSFANKKIAAQSGKNSAAIYKTAMGPNDSQNEKQPRNIKTAPFAWQHKKALRMIRDNFEDGHGHSAFALATYLALTELASDAQSETFTAPISKIAQRAGASYRTTQNILNQLESLNLIAVERSTVPGTKLKAPSQYTLIGTPCLTLGKREARRLPRRVKKENNLKNHSSKEETQVLSRKLRKTCLSHFEGEEFLSEDQRQAILYYNTELTSLGWLPVTKLSNELEKALDGFDADDVRALVDGVTGGSGEIPSDVSLPKRKTLVRLLWDNY
jgi:DNA-binding IscR family transcriptional regulator